MVFFYFNKVYDSVPRDRLLKQLTRLQVSWIIVKLIKSMLINFKLTIGKEAIDI